MERKHAELERKHASTRALSEAAASMESELVALRQGLADVRRLSTAAEALATTEGATRDAGGCAGKATGSDVDVTSLVSKLSDTNRDLQARLAASAAAPPHFLQRWV